MMFNNISKYRSSLMGIAMLSVFLFHSMGDWMPPFIHNIAANGAIGVDVFLFLSSIGLTYSITKNPSVTAFYKRRVLRIMPTYWFIMTCVYLFVFILTAVHIMPDNYYRIPRNFWEIIQAYICSWCKCFCVLYNSYATRYRYFSSTCRGGLLFCNTAVHLNLFDVAFQI